MSRCLNVLILDSSPDDAAHCIRELHRAGFSVTYDRVNSESSFRDALTQPKWDIVLSDYAVGDFQVNDALEILRDSPLDIPFIVVTGTIDEETAVECLKHGADNYVLKENLTRLASAVEQSLNAFENKRERRRLEEQLRHAQNLEMVGMLAGGVAHDFNNFLTTISGNVEYLESHIPNNEKATKALQAILRAVDQASSVTRALLTFSHRIPCEKGEVNLTEIVEETLGMLKHLLPDSIDIITKIPHNDGYWIYADETQLQQVLLNFTLNARDAMPDGGTLTVSLAEYPEQQPPALPEKHPPAQGMVELVVADNGEGMTEEIQARILEPYFTTKPRGSGTGLGLAIVHGILKYHGASLVVESQKDQGSAFKASFPRLARQVC